MTQSQPLILSIDTATPCSSVALTRGNRACGQTLASLELTGNGSHSRRLLGSISYLMENAAVSWSDIQAVAVSLGPGSFTGLRIGMATAKGLAAAAGIEMVGISTLDSLASKCVSSRLICSVLDARKKEVYTAFYRLNELGFTRIIGEMAVMSPEELAGKISEPVVMIGDGAVVYRELFEQQLGAAVIFTPAQLHMPTASSLGMLACEAYLRGDVLDIGEAVPIYIRSSDAELNLLKKKQKDKGKGRG